MQSSATFLVWSQNKVNDHLADGVVSKCEIVGGVLLSRDQNLREIELSARAPAHTVHTSRPKIDEDRAWSMVSNCVRDESVERVVFSTDGLVTWYLAVRLSATFGVAEDTRQPHPVLHRNRDSKLNKQIPAVSALIASA